MDSAGVTSHQLQIPINDRTARRNLAAFLAAGCPTFRTVNSDLWTLSDAYRKADKILGNDFITPEEVMDTRRGFVYTPDQIVQFEKTIPEQEELEWLRDNGYMLVPGPAKSMSLLDIMEEPNDKYFDLSFIGWCKGDEQRFSRYDRVKVKWLKLRKNEVPNSIFKNADEQQALLSPLEYVPNVAEVAWGIITYKLLRSTGLLKGINVRTSSIDRYGECVTIGYPLLVHERIKFDGLNISSCRQFNSGLGLGMSSARE
jgi:hypothetical protein